MKKKIVVVLLIVLLIATLSLSLVGCVGNQYDFSDFFPEAENCSSKESYLVNYDMYTSEVVSQKHLSGYLYELQYVSYTRERRYDLYNVYTKRTILSSSSEEVAKCSVWQDAIDIVIRYKEGTSDNYKYYLPDGQELCANYRYVQPRILQTTIDSYQIIIDDISKTVILDNNSFTISSENSNANSLTGQFVGALQNAASQELVESLGLSKAYSIDITDGNKMYVLKNKKMVSSFDLSLNYNFIAANKGHIFYFEESTLASDSENYDVIVDGNKKSFQLKSFNLKNGKIKNIKSNYYLDEILNMGDNGDSLISMHEINKDKTISKRVEYFIANGKGIVANVNNSFAIMENIYRLNSKEFLVQTDRGLYLANKYLNVKKDFTQVNFVDVFVAQKAIVVSQNINNKEKYGVIDFTGKIVVPFAYDSYSNIGSGLCFTIDNNTSEYVVYNCNNLKTYQVFNQYDYFDNGVVCFDNRLIVASTNEVIISKTNLRVTDCKTFKIGKASARVFTIEYVESGITKKASVIVNEILSYTGK